MRSSGVVFGVALLLGVLQAPRASSIPHQSGAGTKANLPCPAEQQAILTRASTLMEEGRFQTVIEILEPGSTLRCQVQANLLIAGAFEALGDLPSEVNALERAQKRWPENTSIAASLARCYLSAGMLDKAAEAVQHVGLGPQTPLRELELIANVFVQNHNLQRARATADVAYKGYPSEQTLLLLANILQLEGRYMDVVSLLGRVRAQYESSSPFLVTLAESEYDAQMYQKAQQDVSQALKQDDSSYAGHYVLANTLVKTGDLDAAQSQYELAIQLRPSQPRTYYRLALLQEMRQQTSAAQTSLTQAIAADSRYAPAYGELGKLLLRQNQFQQAVDQLTKAIECNPRFEEAYFLLVQAYARLGEREKSAAVFSQWNQLKAEKTARPVAGGQKDQLVDAAHIRE